jgi:hypothetical protein
LDRFLETGLELLADRELPVRRFAEMEVELRGEARPELLFGPLDPLAELGVRPVRFVRDALPVRLDDAALVVADLAERFGDLGLEGRLEPFVDLGPDRRRDRGAEAGFRRLEPLVELDAERVRRGLLSALSLR